MSQSSCEATGSRRSDSSHPPPTDAERLHAALYCADDCMTRARDGVSSNLPHLVDYDYADKQLMMVQTWVERARAYLAMLRTPAEIMADTPPYCHLPNTSPVADAGVKPCAVIGGDS